MKIKYCLKYKQENEFLLGIAKMSVEIVIQMFWVLLMTCKTADTIFAV